MNNKKLQQIPVFLKDSVGTLGLTPRPAVPLPDPETAERLAARVAAARDAALAAGTLRA